MIDFHYQEIKADAEIRNLVKRFWKFSNATGDEQHYTVLPDGFFDIIIKVKANKIDSISLIGLHTHEIETTITGDTTILGICFKPLAAEYILQFKIADLLNTKRKLPNKFWNIDKIPHDNFNKWVEEITRTVTKILQNGKVIDTRKQNLFNTLFQTKGWLTVQEISSRLFWSSRQINRYFNTHFGLSLKTYCNVLRCKATYNSIKKGDLFPSDKYADQSHFIKEIKKITGVTPKVLSKNKNYRYIQFSTKAP